MRVQVGDKVKKGSVLALVEGSGAPAARPRPCPPRTACFGRGTRTCSIGASAPATSAARRLAPHRHRARTFSGVVSASRRRRPERVSPTAALPAHEPTAPRAAAARVPTIRKLARELAFRSRR
jgi:pyruvate dehydrogenase E2 component (dihydrolipoamide acetyltransferase)